MGNKTSATTYRVAVVHDTQCKDGELETYEVRTLSKIRRTIGDCRGFEMHLGFMGTIPSNICKLAPRLSNLHMAMIPLEDMRKLQCLTGLTELRSLDLGGNDFSSVESLDVVSKLTGLHSLKLRNCQLKMIPSSLLELANLQELDLSMNPDISSDSLHSLSSLSKLEKLKLIGCSLKAVPLSLLELAHLQDLNLSHNPNISTESLPSLSALFKLKKLMLFDCGIKAMPLSFQDLGDLEVLALSFNHELHSLTPGILNMSSLQSLELENVDSLANPPLEVCNQGLLAIRQYYTDLAEGAGLNIPSVTIAVIGQKMSGKTSLILTLKNELKERVLTNRNLHHSSSKDDTTSVFNVEEVMVENTLLRFLDMGGQEVYHLTYQLTLRENCMPVIVVSIKEYKELSLEVGEREAVRRLYFDWMSHLYLAHPNLGPPILVITHKDIYEHTEYERVKESFLSTSNSIRNRILHEEEILKTDDFQKIMYFSTTGETLFNSEYLFEVGNEKDYTIFEKMKDTIHNACKQFSKEIPRSWEVIDEELKSLPGIFVTFKDLLSILNKKHGVTSKQLIVILTFMHASGKIFWYTNIGVLQQYVFHNISRVTKILAVLFHHNGSLKWQERRKNFKPFRTSEKKIVDELKYKELTENFEKSGMMSSVLLFHLLESEAECKTELERKVILDLLQRFLLLIGPIWSAGDDCFMIPYYATGYQDDVLHVGADEMDLKFRVEIYFHGLSLPGYVYHQMTAQLLELFPSKSNEHFLKHNGATVYSEDATIRFTHDVNSRKTVIELAAKSQSIALAWSQIISITTTTIKQTLDAWSAVRPECVFYCPHCLLKEVTPPQKKVDPEWCNISTASLTKHTASRSGMQSIKCGNDLSVPSCLKHPCEQLSMKEQEELKKYFAKENESKKAKSQETQIAKPVVQLWSPETDDSFVTSTDVGLPSGSPKPLPPATLPAPSKPEPSQSSKLLRRPQVPPKPKPKPRTVSVLQDEELEDGQGENSDEDGFLFPADDRDKIIISKRVLPTTIKHVKELFVNTDKVYKMSKSTKGRAMIINNKDFSDPDICRVGSDTDVINLNRLLNGMKFDVFASINREAKQILSDIQTETRREEHDSYGMFILIIMSHGTEKDCVYGTDMKAIDMMDVYDLLSPLNFPLMSGKPKFVIIQACRGVMKDFGDQGSHPRTPTEPPIIVRPDGTASTASTCYPLSGQITHLNVDDLFVMKAGFESYQTYRHAEYGSIFIRCLVNTMYKHANHMDLHRLYEIIQERVRELTIDLAKKYPYIASGQTVIANKTFTHRRKLFFFPGYDGPRDSVVHKSS